MLRVVSTHTTRMRSVTALSGELMPLDRELLLKYLEDNLGVDTAEVNEDTPLFSSGIIDSASMVDLIVFVESEASVKFGPDDITLDYLDSVSRILEFVARRHEQG